jgi:hypothetical protein
LLDSMRLKQQYGLSLAHALKSPELSLPE